MLKIRTKEVLYEKFRTEKLLARRATRNISMDEQRRMFEGMSSLSSALTLSNLPSQKWASDCVCLTYFITGFRLLDWILLLLISFSLDGGIWKITSVRNSHLTSCIIYMPFDYPLSHTLLCFIS